MRTVGHREKTTTPEPAERVVRATSALQLAPDDGPYRLSAAPAAKADYPVDCPEAAQAMAIAARDQSRRARVSELTAELSLGCRRTDGSAATNDFVSAATGLAYEITRLEQRSAWTRWLPRSWDSDYSDKRRQYLACLHELLRVGAGIVPPSTTRF